MADDQRPRDDSIISAIGVLLLMVVLPPFVVYDGFVNLQEYHTHLTWNSTVCDSRVHLYSLDCMPRISREVYVAVYCSDLGKYVKVHHARYIERSAKMWVSSRILDNATQFTVRVKDPNVEDPIGVQQASDYDVLCIYLCIILGIVIVVLEIILTTCIVWHCTSCYARCVRACERGCGSGEPARRAPMEIGEKPHDD